jgi:hypothetical protein
MTILFRYSRGLRALGALTNFDWNEPMSRPAFSPVTRLAVTSSWLMCGAIALASTGCGPSAAPTTSPVAVDPDAEKKQQQMVDFMNKSGPPGTASTPAKENEKKAADFMSKMPK